MTNEEFSNEFDVLVDSYRRFKSYDKKEELDSIEFNEYEKSVFLTKAQDEILIEAYSGRYEGYEQTEEIRKYLSNLNKELELNPSESSTYLKSFDRLGFYLPNDVWFVTFEAIETKTDTKLVLPVNRDSLYKTLQNPFKLSKHICLRVDDANNKIYIIGKNLTDATYIVNYIEAPTPIVLVRLHNNVSINGINEPTECKVHVGLHNKILERAVALAMASKTNIQK